MNFTPLYLVVLVRLAVHVLVTESHNTQRLVLLGYAQQLGQILLGGFAVGTESAALVAPAAAQTKVLGLQLHVNCCD